jgi:hypothetical protein
MNTIINDTYWSKTITEVKLNIGRGKLSFFGLRILEEGTVEENEKFYNKLLEILYKPNKHDYILF